MSLAPGSPLGGAKLRPQPGLAWPHLSRETFKTELLGLGRFIPLETEQRHGRRQCECVPISSLGRDWVREAGSQVRKAWEELGGKERHWGPPGPPNPDLHTPLPPVFHQLGEQTEGKPPCIPRPIIPQL